MYDDNKVIVYKRSEMKPDFGMLSANFYSKEWFCRCGKCEDQLAHHLIFRRLEDLRARLGDQPMTITSGYRCKDHNAKIGGAKRSRHMYGDAADLSVRGWSARDVGLAARETGFTGIKVYRAWTHVDLRTGDPWHVGLE